MEAPDTNPAAEETEAVEETPELSGDDRTDSPPWGDDFDPDRAWSTIQTQRAEETKLKERAKQLDDQWEDERAHLDWLRERGYEFEDVEDDQGFYEPHDDDQLDPKEERLARLEQAEAQRLFNADLKDLADDADVELQADERELIGLKTGQYGNDRRALERAFKEHLEARKAFEAKVIERYRQSKQAPQVPKGGREATDKPDLSDDTSRHQWMAEQWANAQ